MIGTIEDMINTKVTDFTKNGKCTACGQCCSRFLPLYPKEIERIKKYIKKHKIKPYTTVAPMSDEIADFNCPFCDLAKPLKCRIYEIRPEICKDFVCNKLGKPHNLPRGAIITDMRATFFGGK